MVKRVIAFGLVALTLFLAWPLWAGWQLRQAMRTRDAASLEARVDWPVLRANLKPKLADAVRAEADKSGAVVGAVKRAIGGVLADKGVDYMVTPSNLARVLAGREFITRRAGRDPGKDAAPAKGAKAPPASEVESDAEEPDDPMPPRRLRWAFFESPTRFRIEATHPRIPNGRVVAILALQGLSWKLADVDVVGR